MDYPVHGVAKSRTRLRHFHFPYREYHEKHYKPTLLTSVVMLKSYRLEKIFERAFTHLTICVNTLTIYVLMTA